MSELKSCPFCGAQSSFSENKETIAWCKLSCFFDFLGETEPGMSEEMIEAFARSWNPKSGVWVPVSEKMPQDGERVLAFHDDYVVRIGMSENGEFKPAINKGGKITPVTHWKPIPIGPIALGAAK